MGQNEDFLAPHSFSDLLSIIYGHLPSRKSLVLYKPITSSHLLLGSKFSTKQDLGVEAGKKNLVKKNSEVRKMNLREKCHIQSVSNIITFDLYEMDF